MMATSVEYSHSPFWPSPSLAGPETPAVAHTWHDNTATCTWEEVWGALDDGNRMYVALYLSPLINSLSPCVLVTCSSQQCNVLVCTACFVLIV